MDDEFTLAQRDELRGEIRQRLVTYEATDNPEQELHTLLGLAQRALSESASDLTTGLRWKSEKERYEADFSVYKEVLGTLATDFTLAAASEESSTDVIKNRLFNFLVDAKTDLVESDLHRRLEMSRIERMKRKLARNKILRNLGGAAVAAGMVMAGTRAAEAFPDASRASIGIGAMGTYIALLRFAALGQVRTGAVKVGQFFKRRMNSSFDFYSNPELNAYMKQAAKDGQELTPTEIHRFLSDYHLESGKNELGRHILTHTLDVSTRESVSGFIHDAVDVVEASLDEFYGMTPHGPNVYERWRERRQANNSRIH